jgi:hypothetical protein
MADQGATPEATPRRKGPVKGWWGLPGSSLQHSLPGIALQDFGTFALDYVDLARHAEVYAAVASDFPWIPREALYARIRLEAPLGWTDYRYLVEGTVVSGPLPAGAPVFLDYGLAGETPWESPVRILAWRRRVVYGPTAEWVEIRWHPERGTYPWEHQEAATHPQPAMKAAYDARQRGWQLLQRIGRPPAASTEVLERIVNVVRSLKADHVAPTQALVAERLTTRRDREMSPRQLTRLYQIHVRPLTGVGWKDFVQNL